MSARPGAAFSPGPRWAAGGVEAAESRRRAAEAEASEEDPRTGIVILRWGLFGGGELRPSVSDLKNGLVDGLGA